MMDIIRIRTEEDKIRISINGNNSDLLLGIAAVMGEIAKQIPLEEQFKIISNNYFSDVEKGR